MKLDVDPIMQVFSPIFEALGIGPPEIIRGDSLFSARWEMPDGGVMTIAITEPPE